MNQYSKKKVFGLSDIYVAEINENDGSFEKPIQIIGAKSAEVSFDVAESEHWYDNKKAIDEKIVSGGKGKLKTMSLSLEELCLITGQDPTNGYSISQDINPPSLALLFKREKGDGGALFTVVYNVKFSIPDLSAETIENGDLKIADSELEFSCSQNYEVGKMLWIVDSTNTDKTVVDNWFKEVQIEGKTQQKLTTVK